LYFPLLDPAAPMEILAHRLVWSAVVVLGVLAALGRLGRVRAVVRDRRRLTLLAVAGFTISANWFAYIWGVNNGYVVEASLGYFINPLLTVLLGVLVLGERLRPLQWVSLGVAAVAVVVLTVDYGRPPWVALTLAVSFALYGLLKKKANTGSAESLAIETTAVAPFALAYLVWLGVTGGSHFVSEGPGLTVLLLGTGVVTVVPLVCFGIAAIRVPLSVLGPLQYLAPIAQFALGILYFGEHMPASRWAGFALVWLALVLFTVEAVRHARRQLRLTTEASAA